MSRKALVLAIILTVSVGSVGGLLFLLLHHDVDWYTHCDLPPDSEQTVASGQFVSEVSAFVNARTKQDFTLRFTTKEINSFFAVGFVKSGLAKTTLPDNVYEPRIAIEPDKVRLAFRYGEGWLSTIVSVDIGVWLPHPPGKDHNVIALELKAMHAGSLPFSVQSLLDDVSEAARRQNIDVTWYRHNGNPVALLRFQADRVHPTVQLEQLELRQGMILFRGRSSDGNGLQAMLPMLRDMPELALLAE